MYFNPLSIFRNNDDLHHWHLIPSSFSWRLVVSSLHYRGRYCTELPNVFNHSIIMHNSSFSIQTRENLWEITELQNMWMCRLVRWPRMRDDLGAINVEIKRKIFVRNVRGFGHCQVKLWRFQGERYSRETGRRGWNQEEMWKWKLELLAREGCKENPLLVDKGGSSPIGVRKFQTLPKLA